MHPLNGKVPLIAAWPTRATTDEAQIRAWAVEFPGCNFGIACEASGLVVVDVDPRNGGDTSMDDWERSSPEDELFPTTFTVDTGGGGWQMYLATNGDRIRSKNGWMRGVDIKAAGGQVVAPGGIHPETGRPYTVRDPQAAVADLPPAVASRMPSGKNKAGSQAAGERLERDAWLAGAGDVPGGQQRDYLLRGLGSMRTRMSAEETLVLAWDVASRFTNTKPDEPWTKADVAEIVADVYKSWDGAPEIDPVLAEWARNLGREEQAAVPPELEERIADETVREIVKRTANRRVNAAEAAELRGERVRHTAREFAREPKPEPVLRDVLGVGANGLAGPSEAGKSLLVRDWSLQVASSGRNVLLVLSEGTHDFAERWESQAAWQSSADRIWIVDDPVDIVHGDDVDWLLNTYADVHPALVVFDVIYEMGMADDSGTKDVGPVFSALKRISAEWGAATLAVGHNGHNGERRFRGSSMWRQLFLAEWHLGDEVLTCEKSKLTDKRRHRYPVRVDYPFIVPVQGGELATAAARRGAIEDDIERFPTATNMERARRLAPALAISEERARKEVAAYLKSSKG
jgi:hypothetical protein